MVVAVLTVWVMQVTSDQVVDVVAVRNLRMPTRWSVHVVGIVRWTAVLRRTLRGVGAVHVEHVAIDRAVVWMVQMTIVQVVQVIGMFDRQVSTSLTMDMRMC